MSSREGTYCQRLISPRKYILKFDTVANFGLTCDIRTKMSRVFYLDRDVSLLLLLYSNSTDDNDERDNQNDK